MSQWGSSDAASNSVYWGPDLVKTRANTTTRDALYNNTSIDAYISGTAKGVFAIDSTEEQAAYGKLAVLRVVSGGSGYGANATLTFSANNTGTGAAGNTTVNTATGRIQSATVSSNGSGYSTNPTVTVSAPAAIVFNGNTAVTANTIALTSANSKFLVGDKVTYAGNVSSTPGGLTDNATYYISFSNTTVVALASTPGGSNLAITSAAYASAIAGGATLTGETATVQAVVGGTLNRGIAHTGWVLRTEGTGGRAGRVQYEVLVAGGITTDGSDDQFIHDA